MSSKLVVCQIQRGLASKTRARLSGPGQKGPIWGGCLVRGLYAPLPLSSSPHMKVHSMIPSFRYNAVPQVWQTDDLLVSFDGCGLFRPHALNQKWKTMDGWFHVDQAGSKEGRHCVQVCISRGTTALTTVVQCLGLRRRWC